MTGISSLLPSACKRDPVRVPSFSPTRHTSPLEIKTMTWWQNDFHIEKKLIFKFSDKKSQQVKTYSYHKGKTCTKYHILHK